MWVDSGVSFRAGRSRRRPQSEHHTLDALPFYLRCLGLARRHSDPNRNKWGGTGARQAARTRHIHMVDVRAAEARKSLTSPPPPPPINIFYLWVRLF